MARRQRQMCIRDRDGMNEFFNIQNTINQMPLLTYKKLIDKIKVDKKYEILA